MGEACENYSQVTDHTSLFAITRLNDVLEPMAKPALVIFRLVGCADVNRMRFAACIFNFRKRGRHKNRVGIIHNAPLIPLLEFFAKFTGA